MESIKDKNSSCTHTGQGSGEQLLKGLVGEHVMESTKEKKCSCTHIHMCIMPCFCHALLPRAHTHIPGHKAKEKVSCSLAFKRQESNFTLRL